MFGTKKILKDQDGNKIEPYTTEDAILSSDGKSLKDKLSDISNNIEDIKESKAEKNHSHTMDQIVGFPTTCRIDAYLNDRNDNLYYKEISLFKFCTVEEINSGNIIKQFSFIDSITKESVFIAYEIDISKRVLKLWDINNSNIIIYVTDTLKKE